MGQKSTKENKSKYQEARESCNLTREAAAEKIGYISASQIEKIESGKRVVYPDDIVALAKCYGAPELCNHYCSNDCPLGKAYVPEVKHKPLSQITLDLLASMNNLESVKNRLIEIVVDGDISKDEYDDFEKIQHYMKQLSMALDTMQLWVDKKIGDGNYNGILK